MSRAQKRRIENLQVKLDLADNTTRTYREAYQNESALALKIQERVREEIFDLKQNHKLEVEQLRRDHESLLADLLLLEPHLKHYQKDDGLGATWDRERIWRAANHLRGERALESLGYTTAPAEWPDNVTPIGFYHGSRGDLPDGVA